MLIWNCTQILISNTFYNQIKDVENQTTENNLNPCKMHKV